MIIFWQYGPNKTHDAIQEGASPRGLSKFSAILFNHVEQRLWLKLGVKWQRPVRHTIGALKEGWHPGISIGQAPGQDRLWPNYLATRVKKLRSHCRDKSVALPNFSRQVFVDHIELCDKDVELEGNNLRQKRLQTIAVDGPAGKQMRLQAQPACSGTSRSRSQRSN